MKLYVEKVCSWNPTEWEYVELEKAKNKYLEYIESVKTDAIRNKKDNVYAKSFDNWLKTEI